MPLALIITRRETFTRLERVQTFQNDGPLVEVPDYRDVDERVVLKEGETLKDAAEAYRLDRDVVGIREDRG